MEKSENKEEENKEENQVKKAVKEAVKPKKRFRWLRWAFLSLCMLCLISGVILAVLVGPKLISYAKEAKATVDNSTAQDFQKDNNSYIYDDQGSQLAKLYRNRDVKYVKYDDLPDGIMDAFVAIEDKRFYQHKGVDWKSTSKAVYLLVTNKGEITRGGSTITQQLARNVYLSFETSYERKMKEIFLAMYLEQKYSKHQILEFYINNINYANGYYGIGSAAQGYFGKDVDELDIQEIAFLCAIPNNPTYYNPRRNYDHTITRRNTILNEMYQQNFLTESEYLAAIESKVTLIAAKEEFYNYESSYAIHAAVLSFMRMQGYEFSYSFRTMEDYQEYRSEYEEAYNEAKQLLFTGGYKIYTSINQTAQQEAQKAVDDTLEQFTELTEEGDYLYQGACTVVDNQTGLVIAIVGGRSQDTNGVRTLNRAYQSYRQPGSTIKPLIVYTPALASGYTANSAVQDSPIKDGPKNSDGKYLGSISLRRAVELSRNAVAWSLMSQLTPKYCLSFLQAMHFNKIVPDDFYNSASLGGLTYGVSTVEMAGGYSALANSGEYREPTCITGIEDADGKQIYQNSETIRIYDPNAADNMTDILTGVAKNGTARGLTVCNGMPVACKTGTTNGQTCGWFCGYTPYYTVAVYVGADTNIELSNLWGSTYPCTIWKSIQDFLCAGKEIIPFHQAEEIVNYVMEPVTESEVNTEMSETVEETESETESENSEQKPEKPPIETEKPSEKPSEKSSEKPPQRPVEETETETENTEKKEEGNSETETESEQPPAGEGDENSRTKEEPVSENQEAAAGLLEENVQN